MSRQQEARDANLDPITKKPGSHPVGTGVGTAVGGAAGIAGVGAAAVSGAATGGIAGGPVGAAAGLVVGAVVGAVIGHKVGEKVNPTKEGEYWRSNYMKEPYFNSAYTYDDYDPAYRTGYEGLSRYQGRTFEQSEKDLEAEFNRNKGNSRLSWDHARHATRSAWNRSADLSNLP